MAGLIVGSSLMALSTRTVLSTAPSRERGSGAAGPETQAGWILVGYGATYHRSRVRVLVKVYVSVPTIGVQQCLKGSKGQPARSVARFSAAHVGCKKKGGARLSFELVGLAFQFVEERPVFEYHLSGPGWAARMVS